ncbi:P2Y purinoceptor 13-like [Clinocottus analis]|uniref:P2Y purinoceptor 13-like n=1 Tax=Clinocottus analis TaxID=304258 RepID=UPI0035BF83EE
MNQTFHDDSDFNSSIYNPGFVPVLYFLMFPVALLLNGVAAWVSLHIKSTSNFVVYLKNLVAADIIMTLILPIQIVRDLPFVSHGIHILSCYFSAIFYCTQYTCITLLGFISLDRFFKIMIPHNKLFGLTFSKLVSGSVWIILFGCSALPNILLNKSVTNVTEIKTCMELKAPVGLIIHEKIVICLNVFFWFVSAVVIVCYICIANKVIQSFRNSGSSNSQGQQKIKLRVFVVLVVFFGSFGPYHIFQFMYTSHQVNSYSYASRSFLSLKLVKDLSHWFACTNICMDPLLYVFLCREFKEKLTSMMKDVVVWFRAASPNKAADALPQSAMSKTELRCH